MDDIACQFDLAFVHRCVVRKAKTDQLAVFVLSHHYEGCQIVEDDTQIDVVVLERPNDDFQPYRLQMRLNRIQRPPQIVIVELGGWNAYNQRKDCKDHPLRYFVQWTRGCQSIEHQHGDGQTVFFPGPFRAVLVDDLGHIEFLQDGIQE